MTQDSIPNLFDDLGRSERQELGVQKWVNNKLCGSLCWATGVGKTRGGIIAIRRFLNKNPGRMVLVVVPSDPIKDQWVRELAVRELKASVITMYMAARQEYKCDMLVIDEIHKTPSNTLVKLFDNIKYKIILGLTATFNRLDGRDAIVSKYAPVVDTITLKEAIQNGWLSSYVEYKILIEAPDIEEYRELNRRFNEAFAFFGYDFNLAMNCVKSWQARASLAKERTAGNPSAFKDINKQILVNAMEFHRTLAARKKFIQNHPKKLEIANLILEHRQDKKCITFSSTISMAEKIKYGKAYSGKDSAKKGRITLEEFKTQKTGVINTVAKLNEGFNDPSISVAIILGLNSSTTISRQRIGRVLRLSDEHKSKEVFTLVLKNTQDEVWFEKSTSGRDYITIDEENLIKLLNGEEFTTKVNKPTNMLFTA